MKDFLRHPELMHPSAASPRPGDPQAVSLTPPASEAPVAPHPLHPPGIQESTQLLALPRQPAEVAPGRTPTMR